MPETILTQYSCEASRLTNLKEESNGYDRILSALGKIVIVFQIILFTNHLSAKNFNTAAGIPENNSSSIDLIDQSKIESFYLNGSGAYTLKGIVRDSLTGEPLPFAVVYIKELNIGAQTDIEGSYLLKIPENRQFDSLIVTVSFVGYQSNQIVLRRKQFIADGNFFYNFNMVEQPLIPLPPPGPYYDAPRITPLMGVVSKEEIERMPAHTLSQYIKGVVRDSVTNEPMALTVIQLMDTNILVATDVNGYFELNVSDSLFLSPLVFIVSYVGYQTLRFEVKKEELPLIKDIYLKPLDTSLNGVGGEKSRKQLRRERRQLHREGFIIYED
jgi:hypothetical protein